MSWKFGAVYIKPGFENPEQAIRFLNIDKRYTYETLKFSDIVNTSFSGTAVGNINNITLIHDNSLPYNNSYEADTFTDADFNMQELSKNAEIISFFLDGTTESYGLNHFKHGQRSRRYSVMGGSLILREGDFSELNSGNEEKILKWVEEFTGIGFNQLLINKDIMIYNFTETGF